MQITFKDRLPPRYQGDFEIATSGQLQSQEVDLLNKIGALQTAIETALNRKQDLRPSLADARKKWWADEAGKLRQKVEEFSRGTIAPDDFIKSIEEIDLASEPDLAIRMLESDKAKFDGDFELVPVSYAPDDVEKDYLDKLSGVLGSLRRTSDGPDRYRALTVQNTLKAYKQGTANALRKDCASFREGKTNHSDNLLVLKGRYLGLRDRLNNTMFSVRSEKVQRTKGDKVQELAVDLVIRVEEGLPPPNDVASTEKQDLYLQISNACTVIRSVCQKLSEQKSSLFEFGGILEAKEHADQLLDEYITKLVGVATVGLEGSQVALAQKALTGLKSEFVAREAGRIKTAYVQRLAWWSGGFALVFLLAYIRVRLAACTGQSGIISEWCKWTPWYDGLWWRDHQNFLLAAFGASIGTWVSFSARRLDLPFEDLAMQEESSLDPPFRIIFVVALTLAACLLFWTGALNIAIGDLKTAPEQFSRAGTVALLIGLFCGLSERALATAIAGRAAAFVKGVGGA